MIRLAAVLVVLSTLLASCSADEPQVVLQATRGVPVESLADRVQSVLAEATDLTFLGTVTSEENTTVLVTFTDEFGEACVAIFQGSSFSTGCGDLNRDPDGRIVLQTGDRDTRGVVVNTAPEVTEVRVTTGSGGTYAVPSLGSFSYIEFDDDRSGYTLALVAGDEVVHTE